MCDWAPGGRSMALQSGNDVPSREVWIVRPIASRTCAPNRAASARRGLQAGYSLTAKASATEPSEYTILPSTIVSAARVSLIRCASTSKGSWASITTSAR